MTISLKPGVTLLGLVPQMVLVVIALHELYRQRGTELVITAGNDGTHKRESEHYGGRALDVRTRTLPDPDVDAAAIVQEMKNAFGQDFVFIYETDHIHAHYEPKRPEGL